MEHAQAWQESVVKQTEAVLQELSDGSRSWVSGCPVREVRRIGEDGKEEMIGDIGIHRCDESHMELSIGGTAENARALAEENDRRPAGDPDIVWSISDYIDPRYQGQGIMSAVLAALLKEWAIPRMGVRKIVVSVFEGNYGSVRMFEKNGFKLRKEEKRMVKSRGELRGVHVLDWKLEGT